MIQLKRVRNKTAIVAGLRGKGRKEKAVLLVNEFYAKNFDFKSSYWTGAKKQLKKESFGKCAYCEAPTNAVAHGDVEHFRPKSIYWWLAYCYENYSYACQICNQSYKSDNFQPQTLQPPTILPQNKPSDAQILAIAPFLFPDPLTDGEGHPFADFKMLCEAEKTWLIDPYLFNPEQLYKWEVKEIVEKNEVKEIKIEIAARDNSAAAKNAFEGAITFLGLNREELSVLRGKKYRILRAFANTLQKEIPAGIDADVKKIFDDLKSEAKQMLKEMIDDSAPFAGMSRYFVFDVWQLKTKLNAEISDH